MALDFSTRSLDFFAVNPINRKTIPTVKMAISPMLLVNNVFIIFLLKFACESTMNLIKIEELSELSGTALWIKENFEAIFLWFSVLCIVASALFILKLYLNRQK